MKLISVFPLLFISVHSMKRALNAQNNIKVENRWFEHGITLFENLPVEIIYEICRASNFRLLPSLKCVDKHISKLLSSTFITTQVISTILVTSCIHEFDSLASTAVDSIGLVTYTDDKISLLVRLLPAFSLTQYSKYMPRLIPTIEALTEEDRWIFAKHFFSSVKLSRPVINADGTQGYRSNRTLEMKDWIAAINCYTSEESDSFDVERDADHSSDESEESDETEPIEYCDNMEVYSWVPFYGDYADVVTRIKPLLYCGPYSFLACLIISLGDRHLAHSPADYDIWLDVISEFPSLKPRILTTINALMVGGQIFGKDSQAFQKFNSQRVLLMEKLSIKPVDLDGSDLEGLLKSSQVTFEDLVMIGLQSKCHNTVMLRNGLEYISNSQFFGRQAKSLLDLIDLWESMDPFEIESLSSDQVRFIRILVAKNWPTDDQGLWASNFLKNLDSFSPETLSFILKAISSSHRYLVSLENFMMSSPEYREKVNCRPSDILSAFQTRNWVRLLAELIFRTMELGSDLKRKLYIHLQQQIKAGNGLSTDFKAALAVPEFAFIIQDISPKMKNPS